ncbi:HEAT repeat domain-containing protein [Streptomyces canus]|uniref:HEAT repeat domain-containing protein n=1 Tax=Streptomyces canus TaxID=58343 RepID=UPI002256CA47|nr:HEAT repeat domain-containing protein [Streptomyces canus]MCX5254977.1 HEAT repeat domain-containing protein [Streptomyces canus]
MTSQDDYQSADQTLHGPLPDPRSVLEGTDWTELEHAYGVAQDTPLRLLQLLDEDPEVQAGALELLDMSVLHQESLYSATAPAALYVAAVLNDPRTLARHETCSTWDDQPRPLRAALLEWLGQIADSAAYGETGDEEDGNDAGVSDAVRAVRGTIHDAVCAHVLAPDPTVRAAALSTTSALLQAPELAIRIYGTAQVLRRLLTVSTDRRERANTVLTIGAWGQDTTIWLEDPDPAIRACAALSPACADNANATRTILRALLEPVVIDSWFLEPTAADPWAGEPLPHIEGRLRYALLSAAIERATDFEELLPAAMASVPFCSNLTIAQDWGPLLTAAFPSGYDQGTNLTPAQHRYLDALADRDVCWRHTQLITSWFDDIGLPADRGAIRALLSGSAPGRNTARFE